MSQQWLCVGLFGLVSGGTHRERSKDAVPMRVGPVYRDSPRLFPVLFPPNTIPYHELKTSACERTTRPFLCCYRDHDSRALSERLSVGLFGLVWGSTHRERSRDVVAMRVGPASPKPFSSKYNDLPRTQPLLAIQLARSCCLQGAHRDHGRRRKTSSLLADFVGHLLRYDTYSIGERDYAPK